MSERSHSHFVTLVGQLQTSGTRCVLVRDGELDCIIKCPGLGPTLIRDTKGISVKSGSPMVDVKCRLVGRFVDEEMFPAPVFGDIKEIIVFSNDNSEIPLNVSTLKELSATQLLDCQYFEEKYRNNEIRDRCLQEREAW